MLGYILPLSKTIVAIFKSECFFRLQDGEWAKSQREINKYNPTNFLQIYQSSANQE